jgi:hypothetical protein
MAMKNCWSVFDYEPSDLELDDIRVECDAHVLKSR